jgi:hypothetical protein
MIACSGCGGRTTVVCVQCHRPVCVECAKPQERRAPREHQDCRIMKRCERCGVAVGGAARRCRSCAAKKDGAVRRGRLAE